MQTTKSISYENYTINSQLTRIKGREYLRYIVDFGIINGKRTRRSFNAITKAKVAIKNHIQKTKIESEKQKILTRKIGQQADNLTNDNLMDAVKALSVLDGSTSLTRAAEYYIEHKRPDGTRRTVSELVESHIQSRQKANKRPQTIKDLRWRLGAGVTYLVPSGEHEPHGFALDFKDVDCRDVSTDDLESWIDQNAKTDSGRNKMRNRFLGLFNYACKKKYIKENPAEGLIITSIDNDSKPYPLPVEDAILLLNKAERECPEMIPYFVLCMFAGIRPFETKRLDWSDISLTRQYIYIRKKTSKTRAERYVTIEDNLLAYLVKYKATGKVFFSTRAFNTVRAKAGIRWGHDCLRHSFGSYHLGKYENSGKTAEQMGHQRTDVLYKHYRKAVLPKEAEAFWAIVPESKSNIIKLKMAG